MVSHLSHSRDKVSLKQTLLLQTVQYKKDSEPQRDYEASMVYYMTRQTIWNQAELGSNSSCVTSVFF